MRKTKLLINKTPFNKTALSTFGAREIKLKLELSLARISGAEDISLQLKNYLIARKKLKEYVEPAFSGASKQQQPREQSL